jgi:DNA-binding transcriptional regulator YhcF (GntR family)
MGVENTNTAMGRPTKASADQVLAAMRDDDTLPQVWTPKDVAALVDVSTTTARKRLDELLERGAVEKKDVSGSAVYYPIDDNIEDQHRASLVDEFEGEFVGDVTAPTVVSTLEESLEPGDKIQFEVSGHPGNWSRTITRAWSNRRDSLDEAETDKKRTQALVSGTLYTEPTVPIEHTDYPDDYDLELNIGGQYKEVEGRSGPLFVAAGVKNYLINPCNDALFVRDVSVDWILPEGEGQDVPHTDLTEAFPDWGEGDE